MDVFAFPRQNDDMGAIDDLPLRQITRLRSEMALAEAQLNIRRFRDQPMVGIEFGIAALVSLPDWAATGVIARPGTPTREITIRRMALSLGASPETTRRHVNLLVAQGRLAASEAGVALAATSENEAFIEDYYLEKHDLLIRLIEDLHTTTDLDLAVDGPPAFGMADVIGRAIETLMVPIDLHPLASRYAFFMWAALTTVAVRRITYDPELSRRYAATIPPDELRDGMSLRHLAAMLSIPYASAWRQFQTLQNEGLVTRLGGDRWTVSAANLLQAPVRDMAAGPSVLLYRKVRELARLGLDPARAADHYAVARPALADFGTAGTQYVKGYPI